MRSVLVCALVLALFPITAHALEVRTGPGMSSVQANEVINDDVLLAGQTVEVAGRVNGDVIAFGQSVMVSGPVGGSLTAAGRQVSVTGTVGGSAHLAGETVSVEGRIGRNLMAAGRLLSLLPQGSVGIDALTAGSDLALAGRVAHRLLGAGSTVTISGQVGGDTQLTSNTVTISSPALLRGNLRYTSPSEAAIGPGTVLGRVQHLAPPPPSRPSPWWPVLASLMLLATGLVVVGLAPTHSQAAADRISGSFWSSLGVGVLVLIGVPVVAVLLLITVVGIPLSLLLLLAGYLPALYLSKVFAGLSLGRWMLGRLGAPAASRLWAVLAGLVVILVLAQVPILGRIVRLAALLVGLGGMGLVVKEILVRSRTQAG